MEKHPGDMYADLMFLARKRFDKIKLLKESGVDNFDVCEIAAIHGRKIIESIAFGCMVATQNGLKIIPKDTKGQYNAETILKTLKNKNIETYPSPSIIRKANEEERVLNNVDITIEGIPIRRISKDELIKKYQRTHNWLHELNPYTKEPQENFHKKYASQLWTDLKELDFFLDSHFISIKGQGFFCTLWDSVDGQTKVIPLSKPDH